MRKIERVLIVLILVVSGFSGLLSIAPSAESDYTPHDPIFIDGNDDFALQAANESWPGDGSEANPYVIEGLEINISDIHCIASGVDAPSYFCSGPDSRSAWKLHPGGLYHVHEGDHAELFEDRSHQRRKKARVGAIPCGIV